jgi:microcystin-dependent protein
MAEPFMAETRVFSFSFAPRGWALCNGQVMPINQNQALFSLLGTTYGGNGQNSFALPNLQGRTPIHMGAGRVIGEASGAASHTLTQAEIPAHTHAVTASASAGNLTIATGNLLASGSPQHFHAVDNNLGAMHASTISNVGGSQAHENRQPFFSLNFCIALQGIFPSRS